MEFVCLVWISEETTNFALHKIKRLVFITEVESVYYAVRTESLCNTDTFRLWKVKMHSGCDKLSGQEPRQYAQVLESML